MTDVHVVGSINRTLRGAKSPPVLLFCSLSKHRASNRRVPYGFVASVNGDLSCQALLVRVTSVSC
jgi:hypothetical protein